MLPDAVSCALLGGQCPNPRLQVRLTSNNDKKCLEKTLEGLDVSQQSEKVYLLQLKRSLVDTLEDAPFLKAKEFYGKGQVNKIGRTADWFGIPCRGQHPSVAHSVMTYSINSGSQSVVVTKTQRLTDLEGSDALFAVRYVSQKHGLVHLFVENCPEVPRGTVVWISGVHSQLDGCRAMVTCGKAGAIAVMERTSMFAKAKQAVSGATVAFVAVIEPDALLFEIQLTSKAEAARLMPMIELKETETDSSAESSDEEDTENKSPVFYRPRTRQSVIEMPVATPDVVGGWGLNKEPTENSKESLGFGQPVHHALDHPQQPLVTTPAPVAVQHAQRQTLGWGQPSLETQLTDVGPSEVDVFQAQEDPVTYLQQFFREEPQRFKTEVLQRIMQYDLFKDVLHRITHIFGEAAVRDAFDGRPFTQIHSNRTAMESSSHVPAATATNRGSERDNAFGLYGSIPPIILRAYQHKAVDEIMRPGNFLVGAATGSGKTRIFVEVARRTLLQNKLAKIVVVVPKRALTTQHVDVFNEHMFSSNGFRCGAYCSDTSSNVVAMLENSVIVITAERLNQHFKNCEISFDWISLLVLDEAHHTKANHPYKSIMEKYHYRTDLQQSKTKVLGLTATPAQGREIGSISANFEKLLRSLHVPESNFIHIRDENTEIQQNIPQAVAETEVVEVRPCDKDFRAFISDFVSGILRRTFPNHLSNLGLSALNEIKFPSSLALLRDDCSTSQFQQWRCNITTAVQSRGLPESCKKDIIEAVCAICLMDEAVQQSKDLGYESALTSLLGRLKGKKIESAAVLSECESRPNGSLFSTIYSAFSDSPYMQMLPETVLVSGLATSPDCGRFPKFAKLIEILGSYKNQENFHGMVFIRTRSAADQICQMLQTSCLKNYMGFKRIFGQSQKTTQTQGIQTVEQGMSLRQQTEILNWFKEAGRKVLVTTNVCEEGINVVYCELVVRYTSALSGTEHQQSMGRARKQGARFVCIIEKGSKDCDHLRRCEKEAKHSKETLLKRKTALRI